MTGFVLLLAIVAALLLPATAQAEDCGGYPQPRVYLGTQSWWADDELASGGDTQHVHAETCFPLEQVVSEVTTLDVVVKMHNEQGRMLRRVRVDAAAEGQETERFEVQPETFCESDGCTFNVAVPIDTSLLPAGRWEWRVAAETSDGTAAIGRRNLATSGWVTCVRSCEGVTPRNERYEARGWYRTVRGSAKGYINGRWGWLPSHDAEFPWRDGAFVPVSGVWCPPLKALAGVQEGTTIEPIERSFVSIDPDFHHGSPGFVLHDEPGGLQERVCVDTTAFPDGQHKLFVQGYSSDLFLGQLWGGFVIPFEIANG